VPRCRIDFTKELWCLWPIRNWERVQDGKWIVGSSRSAMAFHVVLSTYYELKIRLLFCWISIRKLNGMRVGRCVSFVEMLRTLVYCSGLMYSWWSLIGLMEYWSAWSRDTWLILPVVICFVRGLSHACLSMNTFCTVKLQIAHYISYSLFDDCPVTRITVVILELIRAQNLDSREKRCTY
jgi:hypothetical protein